MSLDDFVLNYKSPPRARRNNVDLTNLTRNPNLENKMDSKQLSKNVNALPAYDGKMIGYTTWEMRFKSVLDLVDSAVFVLFEQPDDFAEKKQDDDLIQANKRLFMYLMAKVHEDALARCAEEPKLGQGTHLTMMVRRAHTDMSYAQIRALSQEFYALKFDHEDEDVAAYVSRGNRLRRKLSSVHQNIVPQFTDTQYANLLLVGAPADMQPLLLQHYEKERLSLNDLVTALSGARDLLAETKGSRRQTSHDRAYNVNNSQGLRECCRICGSVRRCPIRKGGCLAFCDHCKRKGHPTAKCWKRLKKKPQSREAVLAAREAAVKEKEDALAARETQPSEGANYMDENHYAALGGDDYRPQEFFQSLNMVTEDEPAAAVRENVGAVVETIVDSGASSHFFNDHRHISDMKAASARVTLADATPMTIQGVGSVGPLQDVKFVPGLDKSLMSVSKLTDTGKSVMFTVDGVYIVENQDPDLSNWTKLGDRRGNLYVSDIDVPDTAAVVEDKSIESDVQEAEHKMSNYHLWHQRISHRSLKLLGIAARKGLVTGVPQLPSKSPHCRVCVHVNSKRLPAPARLEKKTTQILELVHLDFCGPIDPPSAAGSRYVLVMKDDYSAFAWCLCLKKRSHFQDVFEYWKDTAETMAALYKQDIQLKTVRTKSLLSDNDAVFNSNHFEAYCRAKNIQHLHITPHEHASNGNAERMVGVVSEMARASVVASGLQLQWDWAYRTAAYVTNRMPAARMNGMTPFQAFTGMVPNLSHLRVFGSRCYVSRVPGVERKLGRKMEPRTEPGVFLGYAHLSKGYVVLTDTGRLLTRRSVAFEERSLVNSSLGQTVMPRPSLPPEQARPRGSTVERKSTRRSSAPPSSLQALNVIDQSGFERISLERAYREYVFTVALAANVPIPSCFAQAVSGDHQDEWRAAIASEKQSLLEAGVFKMVPVSAVPEGQKPISALWVFDVKQKPDGTVSRFKARLCARGFLQVPGRDYKETFAPTVRMSSMRLVMALAAQWDLELDHLDIKCAFLHGNLECKIFMKPPPGYNLPGGMLLQLQKSLYGLKQASRTFNKKLDTDVKSFGFNACPQDPCLYFHPVFKLVLLCHVDDLMLARPRAFSRARFVDFLRQRGLRIGSVTMLSYFVGIQVARDRTNRKIKMHQDRYVNDMLLRFGMVDCNRVTSPMLPTNESFQDSDKLNDNDAKWYRELVGSLLWLAKATRPDIQFAVTKLTRFMRQPNRSALVAAKRVLRFLKGSADHALEYGGGHDLCLSAQCDSSWGNDADTRRSFAGYFFAVNGGAISWRAHLQPTVALSTVEAEYMTYSEVTKEAIWLRHVCEFLGVPCLEPTDVYNDNAGALKLSRNSVHHSRTKHIDIRYHFCRQHVDVAVRFKHRSSPDLAADCLTKALGPPVVPKTCPRIVGWCHTVVTVTAQPLRGRVTEGQWLLV